MPSAFGNVLLLVRDLALERWGPNAKLVFELPLRFDIDPLSGALNCNGWAAMIVLPGGEIVARGVGNSGAGAQDQLYLVLQGMAERANA